VYEAYPHIGPVLPATGYSSDQLDALAASIASADAEVVIAATPVDLAALLHLPQRVVRARYEFEDGADPALWDSVLAFLRRTHRHGAAFAPAWEV
jgi:predicted GTPase